MKDDILVYAKYYPKNSNLGYLLHDIEVTLTDVWRVSSPITTWPEDPVKHPPKRSDRAST